MLSYDRRLGFGSLAVQIGSGRKPRPVLELSGPKIFGSPGVRVHGTATQRYRRWRAKSGQRWPLETAS